MNRTEILVVVQSILVEHFNVVVTPILWETTFEGLNENFKILGFLLELEQLLQLRLKKEILLVEHISAIIHTPEDMVALIIQYY